MIYENKIHWHAPAVAPQMAGDDYSSRGSLAVKASYQALVPVFKKSAMASQAKVIRPTRPAKKAF